MGKIDSAAPGGYRARPPSRQAAWRPSRRPAALEHMSRNVTRIKQSPIALPRRTAPHRIADLLGPGSTDPLPRVLPLANSADW